MSQIKPVTGQICRMGRCWHWPRASGSDKSQIKAFLKTENNEYERGGKKSFFFKCEGKVFSRKKITQEDFPPSQGRRCLFWSL